MSSKSPSLSPGARVDHPDLGVGVFLGLEPGGYARVFFQSHGERQVPLSTVSAARTWEEEIIASIRPATTGDLKRLWLAIEAEELPLLENAATLTAAKIDLLPHQIVLTHKIANSSPRRFLIADSVGLGKTIETALVLRELASRGELTRAMMVVPAGLVNNWHRELNETFHLDFEVFGSEGDVTDRKTNAFAKHNRLIASIDTLKRPSRLQRLLQAPRWDLIVFDEAHHLTAYQSGKKVTKTQNFKLAEALREHSRDLLLLSATPHQGDHFRFWMLIRLLNPSLFLGTEDMLANRHRLNSVLFRRTQADACDANGDPLFARRQVHTKAFRLTPPELRFYEALMAYLRDGYNLAESKGNKGRALGFVMTIFQKIAASSFAAVGMTLRRRLLSLTIHEAIVCDQNLDVDGRERAISDARQLVHEMYGLSSDPIGRAEADRLLADHRVKLLRKLGEKVDMAEHVDEIDRAGDEDSAAMLVSVALPAERQRIRELLELIPRENESKTQELLNALGDLWRVQPTEKIVVFTTYLGSVDSLKNAIEFAFPQAGVEVLKGGDHGAKVAAERRFKKPDGPRILICTAAGREGINLQFARVLFNHDLPWNPMDLEQRIGRIHRYGQAHTAQVYNLVSAETIEGQIFLLLEEKLLQIAKTLGKVDEFGQVAEDLRTQILGHLSERISYDRLYQEAVRDPKLVRTRQELEVAMENAQTARQVVWELFQDLDGFRLDDYKVIDDSGAAKSRLLNYVRESVVEHGGEWRALSDGIIDVSGFGEALCLTQDRETAQANEDIGLLGLEHPLVKHLFSLDTQLTSSHRALIAHGNGIIEVPSCLTFWRVVVEGPDGSSLRHILPIAADQQGHRKREIEHNASALCDLGDAGAASPLPFDRRQLVREVFPEMIQRELNFNGVLSEKSSLYSRLLAWIELQPLVDSEERVGQ